MGFLNMLGLMRVEDHNRIVAKQDAVIDLAASHMKGEDFDRGTNHAGRVSLVMARLRAARTRFDKAIKDLAAAQDEIAALRPDAEKFRAKAKADAERKKAQRAAAKKATTA